MISMVKRGAATVGAAAALSGAMLFGTSATAIASPAAPQVSGTHAVTQSVAPSYWCPAGRRWRARWFDNRGWWDPHHHWQRGRWHNPGCY